MTRTLFTVGTEVYEFSPALRAALLHEANQNAETHNAWFEGTVLCQDIETEDGLETERVDVIEVFETLVDDAQTELARLGVTPLLAPPRVATADAHVKINLREHA